MCSVRILHRFSFNQVVDRNGNCCVRAGLIQHNWETDPKIRAWVGLRTGSKIHAYMPTSFDLFGGGPVVVANWDDGLVDHHLHDNY